MAASGLLGTVAQVPARMPNDSPRRRAAVARRPRVPKTEIPALHAEALHPARCAEQERPGACPVPRSSIAAVPDEPTGR